MKANIHPNYKESTVTCACGSEFQTRSIKDKISVEVCAKCHPYYTNTQSRTSHAGKVDKFNKKYGFDKKED